MGPELHLDNQLINYMFAMDDLLKNKGLFFIFPIQIDSKKIGSFNLETIKDSGFDACVQVLHLV
jgi:hypothetical protein